MELHTIELKKFSNNSKEGLTDIVAKVKTALDMWSAFLTRNDLLVEDNLPVELNNIAPFYHSLLHLIFEFQC